MYKVEALVKMNNGLALVLDRKIELQYEEHPGLIIGMDDSKTFVNCFHYEAPIGRFKAFAGREFDIPLTNGEVIHCNGQWWDGGYKEVEKILGIKLGRVAVASKEFLKDVYVFTGYAVDMEKVAELENSYTGKTYEYNEYRAIIKNSK